MIQSMTGFGKVNAVVKDKKISVEIRSLNSKGLDLTVKLPSSMKELEADIRQLISSELDRGKIDVGVYLESEMDETKVVVDKDLAKNIFSEIKSLNQELGLDSTDYLLHVLRHPNVLQTISEEVSELEKDQILQMVKEACSRLIAFRETEGAKLSEEFTEQIRKIRIYLSKLEQFETERIPNIKERIQKGIEELKIHDLDNNRFEQELIYYIEKLDISEEKMRLNNHLDYFLETMSVAKTGKKLGFIAQEVGREINTLGSKSNHSGMQHQVVEMKDCLEKIKEQIANTL